MRKIVDQNSAVVPGACNTRSIPINNNHVDMAKFGYQENNDYIKVSEYLQEMAKEAPVNIERQWDREDGHLKRETSTSPTVLA